MGEDTKAGSDVPVWLMLVLPLLILIAPFAMKLISPGMAVLMTGEKGIIENLTVISLVAGIVYGFRALRYRKQFPIVWFQYWILLLMLGCFYFAGEELSWGQHYFQWHTPDYWLQYNDQQETNLHNTSALFDQLPRTLLTLAAVIGGVIVPLVVRKRRHSWAPNTIRYWLWPTMACMPVAAIAVLVGAPEKSVKALGETMPYLLNVQVGEIKECFLGGFMMMYLASVYYRARALSAAS